MMNSEPSEPFTLAETRPEPRLLAAGQRVPMFAIAGAHPDGFARRNAILHVLEGAVLIGSGVAVNPNTVGPSMVADLGGPSWAVVFMPVAAMVGYSLGPILSAHRLDGQTEFLPILRRNLPWARILPLAATLALWFSGRSAWSLWSVVFTPLLGGLLGGLTIGAWQQLVGNTVAPRDRASMLGARYLLSNLLGLGMASLVTFVLSRWPGPHGYSLLHATALVGGLLGCFLILQVREPRPDKSIVPNPNPGFMANLRQIPSLFACDRRLGLYVASAVLSSGQFLFIGFLGLHAVSILRAPTSFVGSLTSAQMVGAVAGTLAAMGLGRWKGARFMLVSGRGLLLLSAILALVARTPGMFQLAFGVYGSAVFVGLIGHNTMCLMLPPPGRSSTILGVFSVAVIPSMLLAGQIGAWLWNAGVSFALLAVLGGMVCAASLVVSWRIHDGPSPASYPVSVVLSGGNLKTDP